MRQHAKASSAVPNNQRSVAGATQLPSNNNMEEVDIRGSRAQTKLKDQREAKQKRNEWRITKMILVIFMVFLACYLPITIIKVADKDVKWPGLHIFGYIMIYMSASLNPIIYVSLFS
jgi:Flp pilus assembly protein TadB